LPRLNDWRSRTFRPDCAWPGAAQRSSKPATVAQRRLLRTPLHDKKLVGHRIGLPAMQMLYIFDFSA
jgi:hypothetical protein